MIDRAELHAYDNARQADIRPVITAMAAAKDLPVCQHRGHHCRNPRYLPLDWDSRTLVRTEYDKKVVTGTTSTIARKVTAEGTYAYVMAQRLGSLLHMSA